MKKLYTLFMVAGASVLTCSAVNPNPVSPAVGKFGVEIRTAEIANLKTAIAPEAKGIKKVSSKSDAPATLEGLNLNFCYDYVDTEGSYPQSNLMTFKLNETDEYGVQHYTASGFLQGIFIPAVTVHDLEMLYDPSSGTLGIPAGQTITTHQGTDFAIWNWRDNQLLSQVPFYFEYTGDGFSWINPIDWEFQDTGVESYMSIGLVGGTIVKNEQNQDVLSLMFHVDNLAFRISQGSMTFTADMQDRDTGAITPTNLEGALYTSIKGNVITVENFAAPIFDWIVPFTIDTQAKTFTCENVQVGTESGAPVYLSQAEDLFNKYESENAYKIVAPYTCANGKTTVEIGEWNTFFFDTAAKEDANTLVPMYNTKMVFNFDIDAIMAGVGNVVVDEADTNAPVEYFNLQGVRVQNPENGLYIRRQGKSVSKVIL